MIFFAASADFLRELCVQKLLTPSSLRKSAEDAKTSKTAAFLLFV